MKGKRKRNTVHIGIPDFERFGGVQELTRSTCAQFQQQMKSGQITTATFILSITPV
jgi:hypothetical protein